MRGTLGPRAADLERRRLQSVNNRALVDRLQTPPLNVGLMIAQRHPYRWLTSVAFLAVLAGVAAPVLAANSATASTASSPPSDRLTLRVGTDDDDGRPAGAQILEFAAQVADRSGGAITIEPTWHAAGEDIPNWDQAVAGLVTSGDLEMGLIPTRAWDMLGVTSLQALNT